MVLAICDPPCINGDCIAPDTCQCQPGYTGTTCNTGIIMITLFLLLKKQQHEQPHQQLQQQDPAFTLCKWVGWVQYENGRVHFVTQSTQNLTWPSL